MKKNKEERTGLRIVLVLWLMYLSKRPSIKEKKNRKEKKKVLQLNCPSVSRCFPNQLKHKFKVRVPL